MTVLEYLQYLDRDVTLAVNSYGSPVTDQIWQFFSMKEVWYPLYLLIALGLVWRLGWKQGLVYVVACVLTVVACDQTGNFVKDTVQRLRPCWDQLMLDGGLRILEDKGGQFGFYSAHAANAMGLAVCSYKGFCRGVRGRHKLYGTIMILWALLVGVSRVFVGKHFCGDVLVGFVAGVVFACIFAALADIAISVFRLSRR